MPAVILVLVNVIVSVVMFLVQKFLPFLIKKFGLGAVKFGIQKAASVAVVLTTVAFYAAFIIFISETVTQFKSLIGLFNNPASSGISGKSAELFSCFLNLLHVSGIANGFNSAMSFGIAVLIFFFTRGLYGATIKALKIVSDEINKSTKLI